MIDHRLLSEISLSGIVLDLIGGLYLAYDLLGGTRGPLRPLTRVATYSLLFGLGYGLPLGPTFGAVAGIGLGLALSLEFRTASRHPEGTTGLGRPLAFAVLRGAVGGIASGLTYDPRFGVAFGPLTAVGLALAYAIGYAPASRPHFTRRKLIATSVRGLAVGLAGLLAGALTGSRGLLFGLEIGLVVAGVGAIVATVSPYIEWWAGHLPPQRLGAYGAWLVLLGFVLQSAQYWVVLLDLPVR